MFPDRFSIEAVAESFAKLGAGVRNALRLSQFKSLFVAKTEADKIELTRVGRRFLLGVDTDATLTGIANVTATPTTAAHFVLYNADTSKTYYFDTIGVFVTAGTPGVGGQLLAAHIRTPVVSVPGTQYAGLQVSNANPASSRGSKLSVKASISVTEPALPTWFQIAENISPNVGAFPGSGACVNRALAGGIMVPPGYGLALAVVGLAGTAPLYAPFAEWVEIETDNE